MEAASSIRQVPHPLFTVSMSLWVATASSYCSASNGDDDILFVFIGLAFVLFGVSLFWIAARRLRHAPFVLIGIALGVMSGCGAGVLMHAQQNVAENHPFAMAEFTLIEDIMEGEYATSCVASVKPDGKTPLKVRLQLPQSDEALSYGDVIHASARLVAPSRTTQEYFWRNGIVASARIDSFERKERHDGLGFLAALRQKALSFFDSQGGAGSALMRAIVFGERNALNEEGAYDDMKITGLAHLVAVSGSHLVTISMLMSLALRFARVPRGVGIALQVIFVCAYLVLTAMPLSAIRAACMVCVTMTAFFAKRRASSLMALSVCIGVMIAHTPQTALSMSFLLSIASTLGIVLFAGLFMDWLRFLKIGGIPFVSESLALTGATQLCTAPVSGAVFSQISLIAPVSNIVAIPFFVVLCVGGFIATMLCFLFPAQSDVILAPLIACAQVFCDVAACLAHMPYACIPYDGDVVAALVMTALSVTALWVFWPRPSKRLLAGVLGFVTVALSVSILAASWLRHDEIIMLDVGQGDAFLVRSEGRSVLIDTGNKDADLLAGLARHGAYRLDAVIISHSDDDHVGSLDALKGVVAVESVYVAQPALTCTCVPCENLRALSKDVTHGIETGSLEVGDHLKVGNFDLSVIWPDAYTDKGGNADSLTMVLSRRFENGTTHTALFCGDAEAPQIEAMIRKGLVGDIDILKVGHHGSRQAVDGAVMDVLSPEVSLISVGEQNRYGHPTQETLNYLALYVSDVYRTDKNGDVICRLHPEGISVHTLR